MLLGARDVRAHPGGDAEFIQCAQDGGTRRAGLVAGRDEMRLRRFGGPASVLEFVQQVELDVAALVFGFRQRLHVVRGFEMRRGLPHRRYRCAPRCGVRPGDQLVALAERHVTEQAFIDGRIRLSVAASAGCAPRRLHARRAGRRSTAKCAPLPVASRLTTVRCSPWRRYASASSVCCSPASILTRRSMSRSRTSTTYMPGTQLADQRLRSGALDDAVRSNIRPGVRSRIRPNTPKGIGPRQCMRSGASKRSDSFYV